MPYSHGATESARSARKRRRDCQAAANVSAVRSVAAGSPTRLRSQPWMATACRSYSSPNARESVRAARIRAMSDRRSI